MCCYGDLVDNSLVVGTIAGIPLSQWVVFMVVSHSHKVCFVAIQRKTKQTLMKNKAHFGTLWKIKHTFPPLYLDGIIH